MLLLHVSEGHCVKAVRRKMMAAIKPVCILASYLCICQSIHGKERCFSLHEGINVAKPPLGDRFERSLIILFYKNDTAISSKVGSKLRPHCLL
jgi:hypothetical protein